MTFHSLPAVFIGHGSPMLALEDNPFTPQWQALALAMPKPQAVVCVSAHWQTLGTAVGAAPSPAVIHDFAGFPPELYRLDYPAPGNPEWAVRVQQWLGGHARLDHERGLDHGVWTVLRHMYPAADVPVVTVSLDRRLDLAGHWRLASLLRPLRENGILLLGSGNLVHNLPLLDHTQMAQPEFAYDWARRAQAQLLAWVRQRNWAALTDVAGWSADIRRAIPTPEHFLPLLYVLAQAQDDDELQIFNTGFAGGSLDMSCVAVGGN